MNIKVLLEVAHVWVDVFDYDSCGTARTPPLQSLQKQVRSCRCVPTSSFEFR